VPGDRSRPVRSDAERNRQRLLDAAGEVFAEQGLSATLHDVAARAGVSAATAYRNWPNKNELIDELFRRRLDEFTVLTEEALRDPDPWHGLCTYLQRSLEVQLHDRGLSEVLYNPSMGHERLDESRDRLAPMIDAMAKRAKQVGRLRPDSEGTDIVFVQVALTGLMNRTRTLAPDLYRRYLTIVLDGMRADQGPLSKLPVSALTVGETHAIITSQAASSPSRATSPGDRPQKGGQAPQLPVRPADNGNGGDHPGQSPRKAVSRRGGQR
jgi:AcrR family transcriptional regulator